MSEVSGGFAVWLAALPGWLLANPCALAAAGLLLFAILSGFMRATTRDTDPKE